MNLMINWRVRTGQQPTLCDGWWFMNKGRTKGRGGGGRVVSRQEALQSL